MLAPWLDSMLDERLDESWAFVLDSRLVLLLDPKLDHLKDLCLDSKLVLLLGLKLDIWSDKSWVFVLAL